METHFLQFPSIGTLLGLVGILLALFIILPGFNRQRKEPPGPRRLFLFGNLLQLNPKSLESTLRDVRQFINLCMYVCMFVCMFIQYILNSSNSAQKEAWTNVYIPFWTPKSGCTCRMQDDKAGSDQPQCIFSKSKICNYRGPEIKPR